MKTYRFAKNTNNQFAQTLQVRVNDFLKENQIDRKADSRMIVKTIVLFSSFIGVYLFLLFGDSQNLFLLFILWGFLGVGQALIGMTVMHDKVHGAYSNKKWVNILLEIPIIVIGVESAIWKIEHNFIHHNYTNIEGVDQDIHPRLFFRFSEHQERRWFHRFQHVYAVFLYALLILEWTTIKDFKKVIKYHKEGYIPTTGKAWLRAGIILIKKSFFYTMFLGIPLILLDFEWYIIVLMSLTMLLVSGIVMTIIFQMAHVVPQCNFIDPNDTSLEKTWHRHQMETTANFATENKVVTYFLGGLNFQIEHHLFPDICHVHYPKISEIVRSTAAEFSFPYLENKTLWTAIGGHFSLLKKLGTA